MEKLNRRYFFGLLTSAAAGIGIVRPAKVSPELSQTIPGAQAAALAVFDQTWEVFRIELLGVKRYPFPQHSPAASIPVRSIDPTQKA